MPPLRERLEDIILLANHFIEKICLQEGIALRRLTPETMAHLCVHSWPGNVRELENYVERAIALSGEREVLFPFDFPLFAPAGTPEPAPAALPESGFDFEQTVDGIARKSSSKRCTGPAVIKPPRPGFSD